MGSTLKMQGERSPRSRAAGSFKKEKSEVTGHKNHRGHRPGAPIRAWIRVRAKAKLACNRVIAERA